jgi:hypothetical protein
MALTTKFLTRVEENMRVIQEQSYASALNNQWWKNACMEMPSTASAEHLIMLFTAGAMDYGTEGQAEFLDQATKQIDLEPKFLTVPGLRIKRSELDDSNGAGLQKAQQWAADTAVKAAMFPQQKLAAALLANPTCYDGQSFFSTAHPLMPGDPNSSTWKNDLTGAASGDYPGASPLTDVAATDNAVIGKALAYIRGIKGPDGNTCLNLKPVALLASPSIYRVALNAAKAQFVGGTAGSTDVSMQVNDFGLNLIRAGELVGDTSYYIICEQAGTQVGPWIFLNREAPNTLYHGPMDSAELARRDIFEWKMRGRAVVGPGRPQFMFRCKAT